MSIVNFGSAVAAGIAGTQQATKQSSAADQASQDAAVHNRRSESMEKASKAEGVGSNDSESESSGDRDADGRQAWEWTLKNKQDHREHREQSIDTTGQVGNSLDLNG